MKDTPNLRWFEEFPKCRCGKPSSGILRGTWNESHGHHCKKCAEVRLKISEATRACLGIRKAESQ